MFHTPTNHRLKGITLAIAAIIFLMLVGLCRLSIHAIDLTLTKVKDVIKLVT
jgi:uncharacterized protein YoxC